MDEWEKAAWEAAERRLRERIIREEHAVDPAVRSSDEAVQVPALASARQRAEARREALWPAAREVVARHLVEPHDQYWGTQSCWENAARRGADAVALR
jgi:hypothetical protein